MPETGPATFRGNVSLGVGEAIPSGAPPVMVKFSMTGMCHLWLWRSGNVYHLLSFFFFFLSSYSRFDSIWR